MGNLQARPSKEFQDDIPCTPNHSVVIGLDIVGGSLVDLRHKLDKETRKRHFPEMDGGKGSKPRRATEETRKAYAEGWDRIFKK